MTRKVLPKFVRKNLLLSKLGQNARVRKGISPKAKKVQVIFSPHLFSRIPKLMKVFYYYTNAIMVSPSFDIFPLHTASPERLSPGSWPSSFWSSKRELVLWSISVSPDFESTSFLYFFFFPEERKACVHMCAYMWVGFGDGGWVGSKQGAKMALKFPPA